MSCAVFCVSAIEGIPTVSVTYVPSHLYHMLFELFKVCTFMLKKIALYLEI